MDQSQKGRPQPRVLFLVLSIVSTTICALSAVAHYLKWAWGNPLQPIGWILALLLLVLAFSPRPRETVAGLRILLGRKGIFIAGWVVIFVISHLWRFRTAPWNGNGLFDDSAVDLLYLKNYVIGHPFQPAWFHSYPFGISRETLFHYYVWGFLWLFGYNILSYEAALFVLWCVAFIFTLLLVDLFFGSKIVTSIVALLLNFLAFSFIYCFVGYRYPMTVALCVGSLYFLHLGFSERAFAPLYLSLGGISAGLCLASSILGKQYLMVLAGSAVLLTCFHWRTVRQRVNWQAIAIVVYGCVAAATPILCYIAFNLGNYTYYEGTFIRTFWHALQGHPDPYDMKYYLSQIWSFFFNAPGPRLFIPDALPVPLPYYFFLVPGFVLAVRQKHYEIVLLATIPVIGVFISALGTTEHRLLLAVPGWFILMGFTFAGLLKLKLHAPLRISLWVVTAILLMWGLGPSVQYIYAKAKNPFSIYYFLQEEVAVSRFLRHMVAGAIPTNPPELKRNEFNRVKGIPDPPYDSLVCPDRAYSIVHLFLHDYDDASVLSLCGGTPASIMTLQDVWNHNKTAILHYTPHGKDLELIWEKNSKAEMITNKLRPLQDLGRIENLGFGFSGWGSEFYVLKVPAQNIRPFQERVWGLPDPVP